MITALVDKAVLPGAGTVGALSMHYQGAIFYANGGKIGINTDKPQTALEVVGDVRFPNLADPNYSYLATDNNGDLFTTGDINSAFISPWQLTTNSIYYNAGNVGIGVTIPAVKLHVGGNIIANKVFIYSDTGLKDNITPLTNALTGLLALTGYTFDWSDSGTPDMGVLAQEVEAVFPDLVIDFSDDE